MCRSLRYHSVVADGFDTPEEAALAEWAAMPQARARVLSTEFKGSDSAWVVTDTDPSHPMTNYCVRVEGRWYYSGDSN